ncbi:unnamed protein product, partial [Prunus brigantina]
LFYLFSLIECYRNPRPTIPAVATITSIFPSVVRCQLVPKVSARRPLSTPPIFPLQKLED